MDATELLDPFERMLAEAATPGVIRAIEGGASAAALWDVIEASGFLDALVPEAAGGAGLSLADIAPLLMALGKHAVPVPVAETMVARALLAAARIELPRGPIVLVSQPGAVPMARVAEHALIDLGAECVLLPLGDEMRQATGVAHDLAARIDWPVEPKGTTIASPTGGLRPLAALIHACAIAGAGERLLAMTVSYANERAQFGKPIGKQQALQQSLAVMAEQVIACRLAAQTGCAAGFPPTLAAVALAKQVTSAAAPIIANTAHAVHGAIGISAEYDLQLYTRRLHAWRLADGSESWWAGLLGAERLASPEGSVDFIRGKLVA